MQHVGDVDVAALLQWPMHDDALLELLPTFVLVAGTHSISATARALRVPRSTVTRRIHRMEALLGVPLVERSQREVRLTSAGTELASGARDALRGIQTLRERVTSSAGEVRGTLRLASPPGIAGSLVGPFLRQLLESHPGLSVDFAVLDRNVLVADDDFDVVLIQGRIAPTRWIRRSLPTMTLGAFAHEGYLARRGVPRRVEDLARHDLLALTTSGARWPRRAGGTFPITPRLVTNDFTALGESVRAGSGIALYPAHLANGPAGVSLAPVLSDAVGTTVELTALYLPERRSSPLVLALLAVVDAFVAVHTPPERAPTSKRPRASR